LGLTSNRGFMEHPSAGLGAMSGSGASCNGGSIRDPTPGLRTLSGSGASRNPVTGLGPIPGSGTNSAANPMTGPKSGSGALEMIPKREEEYYDDSLLEKSSERPTIASKMTMTSAIPMMMTSPTTSRIVSSSAPLAATERTTTSAPKLDLLGRPISNKPRTDEDYSDPISSRLNSQVIGLKKKTKDDDYDYEEFSSSPSSFLARMRRGVFSFINRQRRRLERHIFGFSEEATSHSITVDKKSGSDKLVNRVIGKIDSKPTSNFAQLPWDDFHEEEVATTTTKKPDSGRIMGKIEIPQKTARKASNWFGDLFETRKTTPATIPPQRFDGNLFGGAFGRD
ncbi:hypothetical protein PENTCL1PPCAC_20163, partial [Pristionchus entomophagus]